MSDWGSKSVDERIAERKAAEEGLRANLAGRDLDGPYTIRSADMFGGLFGGGDTQYAICLACGAMVRLGDPEERDDGRVIERSVRLHLEWHGGA